MQLAALWTEQAALTGRDGRDALLAVDWERRVGSRCARCVTCPSRPSPTLIALIGGVVDGEDELIGLGLRAARDIDGEGVVATKMAPNDRCGRQ